MDFLPSKAEAKTLVIAGTGITVGAIAGNYVGGFAQAKTGQSGLAGLVVKAIAKVLVTSLLLGASRHRKVRGAGVQKFTEFAAYGVFASIINDIVVTYNLNPIQPQGFYPYQLQQMQYARPAHPSAGVSVGPRVRTHRMGAWSAMPPRTQVAI